MKIDITQQLVGYNGEPIQNGASALTLRSVCCEALTAAYPEEKLAGEEKVRRFELARLLYAEDEPDVSVEDLALVKQLVGKGYGPVVVGPAWLLLDPAAPI